MEDSGTDLNLNGLSGILHRLATQTKKLKSADQVWDLVSSQKHLKELERDLAYLANHWSPIYQALQQRWQEQHRALGDPDYARDLEAALTELAIPWQGKFPSYELLPLKFTISLDPPSAVLTLGRKQWKKTNALAPESLSQWVNQHYTRVRKRPFQRERFCKELLNAYECLNRLHNQSQTVKWGHSVSLLDVYDLLTLRVSTRQEYSKVLFTFDLSQLRQQGDMTYKGYRLELAAVRDPGANLVLMNRHQEERVGSLTIYQDYSP